MKGVAAAEVGEWNTGGPGFRRKKLLKFLNVFAIGGTEHQFLLTTEGLDRNKFELHLACFHRRGQFLERVERLGYPLAEYPTRSLYTLHSVHQQLKFARYLRKHRIGIVHTYNFYPNMFAIPAAKLAGVSRVIASVRDTGAYLSPLQTRAQRLVCKMADCIVANADAVRSWLVAQGHEAGKIVVIRNGVDVSHFAVPRSGKLHRELRLPETTPLVAVLARLSPLKGIDDFVMAAARIAARCPDARFVLLGGRSEPTNGSTDPELVYRDQLQALAKRLGITDRIFFPGYRTDVADVLPDLTVSVLPSHSEGLPNAILESMAAGVPVVSTRVGGVPEVVADERTGLLVPPRDPEALANAVCRFLESQELRTNIARAAKRDIVERFSVKRMVGEIEDLYLQLETGGVAHHARP